MPAHPRTRKNAARATRIATHGPKHVDQRGSGHRFCSADRLSTIASLAGGIAHDLGNLLMPIQSRLHALETGDVATARRDLDALRSATDYLRSLTKSLRTLSTTAETFGSVAGTVHVHDWWAGAEPLLKDAIPDEVKLAAEIAPNLPPIRLSPAALTQVLLNLVRNGGEAFKDDVQAGAEVRIDFQLCGSGRYMEIAVQDNGAGMTDAVRARCLEAFFSTKSRSFSAGLGLTLVDDAITTARGCIEIDSRTGRGTIVRLILPVADAHEVATEREAPAAPMPRANRQRG